MAMTNFDSRVFLAPMAGITDKPFRRLVASFGKGNIVSEMVAVNALTRQNRKTWRIADVRDEPYPVIVQLVGGEPELFAEAARVAAELGAGGLDINMGCPVRKIVNNNSGAYLMTDMPRAAKIIETTVRATSLPVSVKFRKGWDHEHVNAVDFARMCEESGAVRITVHGRTRSDFYAGRADWEIIGEVKNAVKIPVVANGDITDGPTAAAALAATGADGVMIGRAALGAPWAVADIDRYLQTGVLPPVKTTVEIMQVLLAHLDGLEEYYGSRTALSLSRKYVCWYCRGLREAKRFREHYVRLTGLAEARTAVKEYFGGLSAGEANGGEER